MSENTDNALAVAALLSVVGQAQSAQVPTPQTTLTVPGVAEMLRCSESLVYTQLKDGRLRGVKICRRRLVPMAEIEQLIRDAAAA